MRAHNSVLAQHVSAHYPRSLCIPLISSSSATSGWFKMNFKKISGDSSASKGSPEDAEGLVLDVASTITH